MADQIPRAQVEALNAWMAQRAGGMVTNPGGTERLHEYWVHGEGAAKIRWGEPGDFGRCVMHIGKFIKDPQGYCNLAHHAALGIYPATHAAMEHKGRSQMADTETRPGDGTSRDGEQNPVPFVRSYPLQDISIRAGGDGRTVDAYAAVFDTPAPIHDADGDYIEVIDRRAFDRILTKISPTGGRANWRCGVFYNHGMTLHGTPSDRNSLPVGIPLEIRADEHGLFTRTRYHKGELADQILEAIREGSLSSYSFSGRFDRSSPHPPRGGFRPDRGGNLPAVRRTESTLREYGPTPFPAYADAAITGVRSGQIVEQLERITELLRMGAPLGLPEEEAVPAAPEERGSAPGDSPPLRRSYRSIREQVQANAALLLQSQYRR
jgi:HK97 family phage prohead protease